MGGKKIEGLFFICKGINKSTLKKKMNIMLKSRVSSPSVAECLLHLRHHSESPMGEKRCFVSCNHTPQLSSGLMIYINHHQMFVKYARGQYICFTHKLLKKNEC